MELILRSLRVKSVQPESPENFTDMLFMLLQVPGVHQDFVGVDGNGVVKYIAENVIYESLESSRSVSKTFGDN